MAMEAKIVLVDDEASIRELVRFNLEKAGYRVQEAADGNEAINIIRQTKPNLVILDLMLPGLDGLDVCRLVKGNRETAAIPIIMLTAKTEEIDKIIGLELGADDYMTKPFSPRELLARIKAVLRRSQKEQPSDGEMSVGSLHFFFNRYEIWLGSEKLELTPKEYELLKLFAINQGKVFTREQLLEKVWGYEYFGDTRTVDVHVRHLRAKLESDPVFANAIETVRGVGYRLADIE